MPRGIPNVQRTTATFNPAYVPQNGGQVQERMSAKDGFVWQDQRIAVLEARLSADSYRIVLLEATVAALTEKLTKLIGR
jgi:hypothetical protein